MKTRPAMLMWAAGITLPQGFLSLRKWENIPCKSCGRDPARVTPCHSAACDYVVSGADGTYAEYNGQYRHTGIRVNGKPVYQLQQSPLDRYIFYSWSWKIGFYWDLAGAGAVYDSPAESLPPTGTWGRESWYEGQTSDSDILQVSPCRGRPSLVVLPVVIVASLATCCLAVRKAHRDQWQEYRNRRCKNEQPDDEITSTVLASGSVSPMKSRQCNRV